MKSIIEDIDIGDLNEEESDNEEMINYISQRILLLEESFMEIFKNKNVLEDYNVFSNQIYNLNNESNDISFSNNEQYVNNLNDPTRYSYLAIIEQLFREINLINETLMKIVKSNYSKNHKITKLSIKIKELYDAYTTKKIDYQELKSQMELGATQVSHFEKIFKSYESELSTLKIKNKELLEKDRLRIDEIFSIINNSNLENLYNLKNEPILNLSILKDQLMAYHHKFTHLLNEKNEMQETIENLRNAVMKKDSLLSNANSENNKLMEELRESIEKINIEKNNLYKLAEIFKKEKIQNNSTIEDLKERIRKIKGDKVYKSFKKQINNLFRIKMNKLNESDVRTSSKYKLNLDESILSNILIDRQLTANSTNSKINIFSKILRTPKDRNDIKIDERIELKKGNLSENIKLNSDNSDIVDHSDSRYNERESLKKNNESNFNRISNHSNSKNISFTSQNRKKDNDLDADNVLANYLSNNSMNSGNTSLNVTKKGSKLFQYNGYGSSNEFFKKNHVKIHLTKSIRKIEDGLKQTKTKLIKNHYEESSYESSAQEDDLISDDENLINKNNLYVVNNIENFQLTSEKNYTNSNNNFNNIININFNNFDGSKEENNILDTPEYKKLFFEIIYQSIKKSKIFGNLANIVDKDEVFDNIDNQSIPYHNYSRYITNYLRKSEPNIINKFVPEESIGEKINKLKKYYKIQISNLKRINKNNKGRLYMMRKLIRKTKQTNKNSFDDDDDDDQGLRINKLNSVSNLNISILDKSIKEKTPQLSVIKTPDELINFNNIYNQITTKFEEVGKTIGNLSLNFQKPLLNNRSKNNPIINSSLLINIDNHNDKQFSSKNNFKVNKEICFKIVRNQKGNKIIDNYSHTNSGPCLSLRLNLFITNFNLEFIKYKNYETPSINHKQQVKDLYIKYLKINDTLMLDLKINKSKIINESKSNYNKTNNSNFIIKYNPYLANKELIRSYAFNIFNKSFFIKKRTNSIPLTNLDFK